MKINTVKYIVLYIIFLFISIFLIKNEYLFINYIKHYKEYYKIIQIKNRNIINIPSKKKIDINWLNLWILDKSNLTLLNWDLKKSIDILNKSNSLSYKYFFNIWNLYFLDSYLKLKTNKSWYINLLQKSISDYNTSLSLIPEYKIKTYILKNLDISKQLLDFMYIYHCDNLFISMINNIYKLYIKFRQINIILKKQLSTLNKRKKYKFIQKCINSFQEDTNTNIYNIYNNKLFFQNVEKWLIYTLSSYKNNEIICYQNNNFIKQKYEKSINSSIKYFNKFYDTQKKLLTIFQNASIIQMTELCQWKNKLAKKQNQENKEMQNNFNNLKDMANKTKPHRQHKKEQTKKNKWKKNKTTINNLRKHTQMKIKELDKTNKNLIQQIQKEITQPNYNPRSYLNKLFKQFYWDNKDFINWIKQNSVWK